MANLASSPSLTAPLPRPYRRFLTTALHKRFVHAALISLFASLNTAFWLGSKKDWFWSWFPFGPAGIKALLFFMSSLFIFILQIATLKIGRQTATSPFGTVRANFLSGAALQTAFWCLVSGWWFTEAYIWSSPDLGWITRGSHKSPDVLNERPVFFRLYALVLALAYAGVHLYRGNSTLFIPVSEQPEAPASEGKDLSTHPLEPIQIRLQRRCIAAAAESAIIAGAMIVITPFINGLGLRKIFWQIHLMLAKPFFNLSRANARPIGYPPLGPTYLLRCFCAGFLMVLTWELTSALFITYLNQQPTKNGLPLSASSKDPNGTLLNGLRAKRDVVKTFAFWELVIIAQKHKDRRRAIFEDIERPSGPMWSQMVEAGLKVLREIDLRIAGPPPTPQQATQAEAVKSLPHIVPEAHTQSIFQKQPKATMSEALVSSPLRQLGSSKRPWHPPVEQTAKAMETRLLEYAKPPGSRQTQSASLLDQWATSLQKSPVGWFFASTNAAKINVAVLGSPFGNAAIIVDVIDSITKMQVASLAEDTYGKATPTVPETVRTFTRTLTLIEDLIFQNSQAPVHGIEEVNIIAGRLRSSLKELLSAFQLYLIDQGLGIVDLNQAKKAIEPPKSVQVQEKKDEQPIRRQLFSNGGQKKKISKATRVSVSGELGMRTVEAPQEQSEAPKARPSTSANGQLFSRREMEQVR